MHRLVKVYNLLKLHWQQSWPKVKYLKHSEKYYWKTQQYWTYNFCPYDINYNETW